MLGAILGDIIGSSYEHQPCKDKNFRLFTVNSHYTDDTVMTLAVARAFLDIVGKDNLPRQGLALDSTPRFMDGSKSRSTQLSKTRSLDPKLETMDDAVFSETLGGTDEEIKDALAKRMREFGLRHPNAGYGAGFWNWLQNPQAGPYNSFGNGSAMRVSPVAWIYNDLELVNHAARLSAEITHNHPEGIKGAQAIASCICLARQGADKAEIKQYVEGSFGYDLERNLAEIRPAYTFDVTCQGSVPEAIIAFLEGEDFEDCIRNAVSLGGDSDTQAAMAGGIAEAYYGLPKTLANKVFDYLTDDLKDVIFDFHLRLSTKE